MIEDMSARQLSPPTQKSHIRACKRFAAFLKRPPETAAADDTQRRFGDTMSVLGHHQKLRLSGGRVHYLGLAWVVAEACATTKRSQHRRRQAKAAPRHNGANPLHAGFPGTRIAST
jgi:hypothetical protein